MNGRGERVKLHGCDFCGSHSCDVVLRKKSPFLHRGTLGRKNGGNCCTQGVRTHSQFAMSPPHPLAHSPDPDAHSGSMGLNLCESFRRHSLSVILNFGINVVGLTVDADYRSLAS
jgi:hypothetical protein